MKRLIASALFALALTGCGSAGYPGAIAAQKGAFQAMGKKTVGAAPIVIMSASISGDTGTGPQESAIITLTGESAARPLQLVVQRGATGQYTNQQIATTFGGKDAASDGLINGMNAAAFSNLLKQAKLSSGVNKSVVQKALLFLSEQPVPAKSF